MDNDNSVKPFSQGYVLRTTAKHMRKCVDISIKKTFGRIADFDGDQAKSQEVFKTLSMLHQLLRQIDDFQNQFKDTTEGSK